MIVQNISDMLYLKYVRKLWVIMQITTYMLLRVSQFPALPVLPTLTAFPALPMLPALPVLAALAALATLAALAALAALAMLAVLAAAARSNARMLVRVLEICSNCSFKICSFKI